jgi:hypothetical protein
MKLIIAILVALVLMLSVAFAIHAQTGNSPIEIQCFSFSHRVPSSQTFEVLTFKKQKVAKNGEIVCRYSYDRINWPMRPIH